MFQYVRVSLKHLWGAVLQSATEGVEELSGFQQGSRAKVDQPDVEFRVYDDIFILYVPVEHSFAMQVTHCGYQLNTEIYRYTSEKKWSNYNISTVLTARFSPVWRCSLLEARPVSAACR